MASSDKIDEYIDIPAVTKETDALLGLMDKLLAKKNEVNKIKISLGGADSTPEIIAGVKQVEKSMAELNGISKTTVDQYGKLAESIEKAATTSIKYGRTGDVIVQTQKDINEATAEATKIIEKFGGSLSDNIKRQIQLKVDLAGVKKEQKDLTKEYSASAISIEAFNAQAATLGETEALIKGQLSELNITIRQQAKEFNATEGSIDQYSLTLGRLKDSYRQLSKAERESEEGQNLLKAIQDLDPAVKGFDESLGNFQRSVGNYAKGFANYSSALNILKKASGDTGNQLQILSQDQNANKDVVQALEKEYELLNKLVNSQEAGFARAATEIRANQQALLALENAGLKGKEVYQELAQATGDLQDQTSDLAATTKQLGSDTFVFDGLIGAAQGLAGVYGIAQGAAALFGEENEDLQKTFVKLQAVETVLQSLQAVSNSLQSESAAILLLQNVRTRALAAGQFLYTAATNAASTATRALRTTLLSSGIGIIVVALGYAISKLADFSEATSKTKKEQDALNDALKDVNNALNEQAKFAAQVNQELSRTAKDQLTVTQARGASEGELLKIKKDIAQTDLDNAKQQLSDLGLTENKIIVLQGRKRELLEQITGAQKKLTIAQDEGNERNIKSFTGIIESLQKELERKESQLIPATEAYNKVLDAQLTIQTNLADQSRFYIAEKQRQLQAERESLTLQADAASAAASNDESSYEIRIAALQKFQTIQKSIFASQRQEQLLDPTLSSKQRLLIDTKNSADLVKLKLSTNKQIDDLNKERIARERAAQFELVKISLGDRVTGADEVLENEKSSYDARLKAMADSYLAKRSLTIGETAYELNNAKLTATEKRVIEEKGNSDLLNLDREFNKNQLTLALENQDKIKEAIEQAYQNKQDTISTSQANAIKDLNIAYSEGLVDLQQYTDQRAALERKYSIESLQAEAQNAFAKVVSTKQGSKERIAAEKELAEATMALSDKILEKELENAAKRKALEQELVSSGLALINAIGTGKFDREKNEVQEMIDLNQQRYSEEIELINASALSEQEKADKISVLNARNAAQKANLELQQRQLEERKARFEKATQISSIIAATANAVITALGSKPYTPANIGLAAISGAIGAAQLATVIATPIPKFEHGTDNAPGGLAIVGEKRREVIQHPDGSMYLTPDRPTLVNLPKGAIVHKSVEDAMKEANSMALQNLVLQQGPVTEEGYNREMLKMMERKLNEVVSSIKRQPGVKVVQTLSGYKTVFESERSQWEYLNRNMQS